MSCKIKKSVYFYNPCTNSDLIESMKNSSLLSFREFEDYRNKEYPTLHFNERDDENVGSICVVLLEKPDDVTIAFKKITKLTKLQVPLVGLIDPIQVNKNMLYKLKEIGILKIIVPLDASTKQIFGFYHKNKEDKLWEKYWAVIKSCLKIFGQKNVIVNLTVGMGETEKQFAEMVQKLQNLGSISSLYSIPEKNIYGTKPTSIGRYRRLQMIRYLIHQKMATINQMKFNQFGSVYEFGVHPEQFNELMNNGKPFIDTEGAFAEYLYNWPGHDNNFENLRNYTYEDCKYNKLIIRKEISHIRWEEEWAVLSKKFNIEEVDISDIDEDIDVKSMMKMGIPVSSISSDDLRYIKKEKGR